MLCALLLHVALGYGFIAELLTYADYALKRIILEIELRIILFFCLDWVSDPCTKLGNAIVHACTHKMCCTTVGLSQQK